MTPPSSRRGRPRRFLAPLVRLLLVLSLPVDAADPVRRVGTGFRFTEVRPATGPDNRTEGFTALPPEVTGITFTNSLTLESILANNNAMIGAGVAAGDVDGDGRCDLYFGAVTGTNALYRNLGGWRFENVTERAGVGMAGRHTTGVAFADLDGDGDLDLLVATLGKGVHAFVNDGTGRFQETTAAAGLETSTGSTTLALGDVDGDGDLDLYVTNYGEFPILRSGGRVQVRRVNGQVVLSGPHARRLRFVNDRLIEVGEPDVLYLNDGQGRFRAVPWDSGRFLDEDGKPMTEPWDFGLTTQIRDLNGDGQPDIYVCNDFETVDRIWLNDGHGTFRALPRLAMRKQCYASMGVDFADLNRDGRLDFLIVEMLGRTHALRQRQMFSMAIPPARPGEIESRPEVTRNTLFVNRGDGTWAEIAEQAGIAASDWTWNCGFLDVDLDGYEDVLTVTGMPYDILDRDTLERIRARGRITPEQARTNLLMFPPLVTSNQARRNTGRLTFTDASDRWAFNSSRISNGLTFADLDDDGDLDVIVNTLNDGPLLYRNDCRAPRLEVRLRGQPPNTAGIGALIRVLDAAVPLQSQEIIAGGRYLSCDSGARTFAAKTDEPGATIEVRWRSGRRSVVEHARADRIYLIEEPAADGSASPGGSADPTAVVAPPALFRDVTSSLGHVHHEELFDDFARQPLLMRRLSQLGPGVAWLDLDGDGHDELVIGTGRGGTLGVFHREASGRFAPLNPADPWRAPDDVGGLVACFSPAGAPTVLGAVARYESVDSDREALVRCASVVGAGGVGIGPVAGIPGLPSSVAPLAVADIDGDGDLDLFVGGGAIPGRYPNAAASRILRQSAEGWTLEAENSARLAGVGVVRGAVCSDLDGDGFPELIVASEWGAVRIFRNERGALRAWDWPVQWPGGADSAPGGTGALSDLTGWWQSVTTGDFDEDGRLDIIAANWGWNDTWRAEPAHPLELCHGDLAGTGGVDLIEAGYAPELDRQVPLRDLDTLRQVMPALAGRFSSHRAWSTASIAETLAAFASPPARVTAATLTSTLFLNRGTHFVAVPLPAEAQRAPALAVCVGDVDGDGHEDVFLSQNFFAVRPGLHRLDAGEGLWLRGDGRGGMTPVPAAEANLGIHGEQRGAALADFNEDGRLDLVVSQNGAPTRLFENVGARPGLRVRFRGPPANPAGLGAVVRLRFGDRSGPAREFHGGSGSGSQDSLVQVFGCPAAPTAAEVQWPGGGRFTVPVPPGSLELSIEVPGTIAGPTPRR